MVLKRQFNIFEAKLTLHLGNGPQIKNNVLFHPFNRICRLQDLTCQKGIKIGVAYGMLGACLSD